MYKTILQYLFATPQRKTDGLNLRAWFLFYALYMTAVCLISNGAYLRYSTSGAPGAKLVWFLGLYMFYFSLACTYIPLPTVWFVLLLASPAGGLTTLSPLCQIVTVAGLGALATAIAHTNEYHVFTFLMRLGKVHLIRETRIYLWAEKQFKIWPFGLLVVFNVLPVPADPARWLAIISRYPRSRFFAAQWLGRFIRYGILALVANSLKLTLAQIIVITILLIVVSFAAVLVQKIRQKPLAVVEPQVSREMES